MNLLPLIYREVSLANTLELSPLTDQSPIVHAFSRFNNHPLFMDPLTRKKFIGVWTPPVIPQKETDLFFEVDASYSYRPDLISYKYYETPLLGWVICYVNNITNPLDRNEGLYAGRVIRISDVNTISTILTF